VVVAAEAVRCCSRCGAVYHKRFLRCPSDGAEVVLAPRDPLLGRTIGRYIIERLIGEGGTGRVYLARLASQRYALKVLLGDAAASPTMRQRFAHEAARASRLVHPNLAGVLDHGTTELGLPYLVMDFIDGRSLRSAIGGRPMAPARAVRIARAICGGLAYAHAAGVIHRDLKPDNILVDSTDTPRILDFGLAVSSDAGDARLTTTGIAMGTPVYAAPEQMAGKRVDHRADLYALGMTMFEMLTGTLPFQGSPLEIMTAKAHADPPLAGELVAALPIELQLLVDRMIRRNPAIRIASAAAVIAALDELG
jgi:eukaryotic-like serine/threonine-protein kinase